MPREKIEGFIRLLRGEKVILDADLAALHGVATRVLVRVVKLNRERFPPDFMFQLTPKEFTNLRPLGNTSLNGNPLKSPPP